MSFDLFDFTKCSPKISSKRISDLEIEVILPEDEADNENPYKKQVFEMWSFLLENKDLVLNNKELCDSLLKKKPKLVDIWFEDQPVDQETIILASFLFRSIFYYTFLEGLLYN